MHIMTNKRSMKFKSLRSILVNILVQPKDHDLKMIGKLTVLMLSKKYQEFFWKKFHFNKHSKKKNKIYEKTMKRMMIKVLQDWSLFPIFQDLWVRTELSWIKKLQASRNKMHGLNSFKKDGSISKQLKITRQMYRSCLLSTLKTISIS